MATRRLAIMGLIALGLVAQIPAANAEPRGVVELFTSQGCNSCPPADKLLGELAKDPSLLVLSLPVDYWDYLGWKDTLALSGHAKRQRAYAQNRGDRNVYTPQAVINGSVQALGSDRKAIERALQQNGRQNDVLTASISIAVGPETVSVTASEGKPGTSADVWLCAVSQAVPVEVGRGENSGKTVVYHNVVRRWVKLGTWTGKPETWKVPLNDVRGPAVDRLAVLLQGGKQGGIGPILAAATASLPR